jgi:hypothetical protein
MIGAHNFSLLNHQGQAATVNIKAKDGIDHLIDSYAIRTMPESPTAAQFIVTITASLYSLE